MADEAEDSNDRAEASCSATERAAEELERLVDEESFRLKNIGVALLLMHDDVRKQVL